MRLSTLPLSQIKESRHPALRRQKTIGSLNERASKLLKCSLPTYDLSFSDIIKELKIESKQKNQDLETISKSELLDVESENTFLIINLKMVVKDG